MNRQINRLAVVAIAFLVALVVGTTYWQTWAAPGLRDRQANAIARVQEFKVARGLIYTGPGHISLATNVKKKVSGQTFYFRRYPSGGLVAQTVGYSTQARSQSGLERSMNDYLTGSNSNLSTVLDKTLDNLKGATVHGNDLLLTINPRAQRLAMQLLGNRCGAVVALEPTTGRVLTIASTPTYNPNLIERHYDRVLKVRGSCGGASALLNRATDGLFVPGSTFKVVTVSAALDTGKYTPDSHFNDPGYCIEYGKQVSNAGNPETGPETFGDVTLRQGLEHSINSVFCNVGKELGAATILDYAKRFGFYSVPPLETPANERAPSGLYNGTRLFRPKHPETQVDPGRLAFGQERMVATPLQMAMVAATIANGGKVMSPYVVERIVAHDHHIVLKTEPNELGRAVKPETAAQVTEMMVDAVESGTGTNARMSGISVAGKTGTAETGVAHTNTTWFVSFAPADRPRVAMAVVLEKQHGFGGSVAAPIAKKVMEVLLNGGPGP